MDPAPNTLAAWRLELIVVREGSHTGGERSAVARDVARGLLLRLRLGVHVERTGFEALTVEQQHLVRMRALAAASPGPVVFSHWSAAVLHGLPVLSSRLGRVHTTVQERSGRGQDGVSAHLFALPDEQIERIGSLLTTTIDRTVVDVAGGAAFEEGVMVADAGLRAGVPRGLLGHAADLAGPRRSSRRIADVIAFAHPGAEGPNESRSRCTMLRLGIEPPELQHRLVLADGWEVFLDFFFRSVRAAGEADGQVKYLDPRMAPRGAGAAVYAEKLREDEVRTMVTGLARWGWVQSANPAALRPVLARIGVVAAVPRAVLADYAAEARGARPRFIARRPLVQR